MPAQGRGANLDTTRRIVARETPPAPKVLPITEKTRGPLAKAVYQGTNLKAL